MRAEMAICQKQAPPLGCLTIGPMGRGREGGDPFASVFGRRRGSLETEQGPARYCVEAEVDDALGLEKGGLGFIGYSPGGYATFHVSASSGRDAQEMFSTACSALGQEAAVISVKRVSAPD